MKRLISLALVLSMLCMLGISASAAQNPIGVLKDGEFYASVETYPSNSSANKGIMKVSSNKSNNNIVLDGEVVGNFYFEKNASTIEIYITKDVTIDVEWHCSKYYGTATLNGIGKYSLPQLVQDNGKYQSFDQIWIVSGSRAEVPDPVDPDPVVPDPDVTEERIDLQWMRSSEASGDSYIRKIRTDGVDAFDYQDVLINTPLRYFATDDVRARANEKAQSNEEWVYGASGQITNINNIWDSGTYYSDYEYYNANSVKLPFPWASWEHFGANAGVSGSKVSGEYSIRRLTSYFDVSEDLLGQLEHAILAPENSEGNMSYFFPINDTLFVFVNGNLAYWGGTDLEEGQNIYDALIRSSFSGQNGIPVIGGDNSLYKEMYPHTDGWCISLENYWNRANIKDFLVAGENRIDVITDDFYEGGGTNKMNLFLETKGDTPKEDDKVVLSGLSWNNGNTSDKDGANGAGLNKFDVNGVSFKNNKNYVTPDNFRAQLTIMNPGNPNIYTVLGRTVTNNGQYEKVYDIMIGIYKDGAWNVYAGTITVDNPGGNNNNQKYDIYRIV